MAANDETFAPAILDARWDFNDPIASEARFRALLDQTSTPGQADYRAEVLTQVARALGLQRRFDEGHSALDDALRLSTRAGELAARATGRVMLERGRLLNSAGESEAAREWFKRALDVLTAAREDFYAVDALHMLGIAGDAESERWTREALAVAEQSVDARTRGWRASLLNNLGWSLFERGRFTEALAEFEHALALRRESGQVEQERIARWTVGRTLRAVGRVDDALSLQQQLVAELGAAGEDDPYAFEELAECLIALGNDSDAKEWFGRAFAGLKTDDWLRDREPERLARLERLAGAG